MQICRVVGDVVSVVKNPRLANKKILLVQPLDLKGQLSGTAILALDTVDAGVGDRVLVMREGGSARIVFNDKETPVQAVITGVVDDIDVPDEKDTL